MRNKKVKPAEAGKSVKPADCLPTRLSELEHRAVSSLEDALVSIRNLSKAKLEAKLSVSRLAGISRELRELIKVISLYGC